MTLMTFVGMEGDVAHLSAVCNNCGKTWPADKLLDIPDFETRVEVGKEIPAGECLDCGALCYLCKEAAVVPEGEKAPALLPGYEANFNTLLRAVKNADLALLSAIRKADRKPVALVVALGWDGEERLISPLAVMVEGNPYELFEDPVG